MTDEIFDREEMIKNIYDIYLYWIMNGFPENATDLSQEFQDKYAEAYMICMEQWQKSEIDKQFVEIKCFHEPIPGTAENCRKKFKKMNEDLRESQRKYNRSISFDKPEENNDLD